MVTIPRTASSCLTINREALRANYRILSHLSSPAFAAPVIKADGYGCGIEVVLNCLEQEDAPFYFVATLEEGIRARQFTSRPIAILNGLFANAEDDYIAHNLTPICASLDQIKRWQSYDKSYFWQIDTGMNRLGIRHDECDKIIALNPRTPDLILSHFISSEDPDDPINQIQIDRFESVRQKFIGHYGPDIKFSMANSSGIFLPQKPHYDITRPGLALFGANPTPNQPNPMKHVILYGARILRIDHVKKGESAGYNGIYIFPHDARIATISLGYADGIPRSLTGLLNVFWGDVPCPIRGRISMDLMIVDISHLETNPPKIGDFLELIGPHQTLEDLAAMAGTISYEILTSLSKRASVIVI